MRCAATEVDPDTGIRDLPIPETLLKAFGHNDCGIYGEVIAGGTVAIGDRVTLVNAENKSATEISAADRKVLK